MSPTNRNHTVHHEAEKYSTTDVVKSRYVPDTFCSVPIRHSMGGLLGGVGAAGSAAGVGEGAVLAGAVVSDGV